MKNSVFGVAERILEIGGTMSAMKMQKLAYYTQAWHVAEGLGKAFPERIEAWVGGPVVPAMFAKHKGTFTIGPGFFKAKGIACPKPSPAVDETIRWVMDTYGDMTAEELSDETHAEDPWRFARAGLDVFERGNHEITPSSMKAYYMVERG